MLFYIIDKKPKGNPNHERFRTDFYFDEAVAMDTASKCAKCGAKVGMLRPLPPLRVHLETWGEGFGDLAFWTSEVLVSSRFSDVFRECGLSGLASFEPVEVLSHKNYDNLTGKPPRYFLVRPKLGAARIDIGKSGIEWGGGRRPTCDVCLSGGIRKRWKSVVVDEESWDGSDVFYAFGLPGTLLASDRFADWAISQQFRNLIMKPAAESSHDFYPWEKP